MFNPTQYEVINLTTHEISKVSKYEASFDISGNHTVTVHLEDGTPIVFDNKNGDGNLVNYMYAIREVGTNSQPDGTGVVDELGTSTE